MHKLQDQDIESVRPDVEALRLSTVTTCGHLANPNPLGFGAFATTLMTLSLSNMGFRGVSNQTLFIGDLCLLAGIGLLISAQWEMVRGNTFSYTVLAAFGLYYGGYGVLLMPSMGITNAYGGQSTEYYNAFGFYLLVWSILNFFFFIASLPTNVPNIIIYAALELSYIFNCSAHFVIADGNTNMGTTLTKVSGAFGFVSALAGFYMLGYDLCRDALPFELPLCETSRFFQRARRVRGKEM
ncbi:GPR1/FUN34/yaaH family-domain-containing protein [Aspergillus cavernicola]|uniref:GPR1/FUN34/yaaH family-domain-containing protein n=1 Tax=Aspergillus cavernicola TaxID=176166 RepID=A0ABR4HRL4_9EURO